MSVAKLTAKTGQIPIIAQYDKTSALLSYENDIDDAEIFITRGELDELLKLMDSQ